MWYLEERPSYSVLKGTPKKISSSDDENNSYVLNEKLPSPRSTLTNSGEVGDDLHIKLNPSNKTHPVCLFGTVAPRSHLPLEKVDEFAKKLSNTLLELHKSSRGIDGIMIYDIQEEESRSSEKRPFAYCSTHPPRLFAKLLQEQTNIDVVVYRCVASRNKEEFENWLVETWQNYHTKNLVFVGASSSKEEVVGFNVNESTELAMRHPKTDYRIGGIVLPERHRDKDDEHIRLYQKTLAGASFFTSQVIYNVDCAIWCLKDYDSYIKSKIQSEEDLAEEAARQTVPTARLIFVFAPFGREDTLRFLKWLGVEIPLSTEKRILSRKTNKERIRESIDICKENLKRILYAIEFYNIEVPIGIAVETVSKYSDEFAGSITLFKELQRELYAFYEKRKRSSRNY